MTKATHLDEHYNKMQFVRVHDDEFPEILHETLTDSISVFSVLFWSTFSIAVLALGLLVCWYCGSRRGQQPIQKQLTSEELPMTISKIAEMDMIGYKDHYLPGANGCDPCRC